MSVREGSIFVSMAVWKSSLFLMVIGLVMIAAGLIWRSYRQRRQTLKGHTTATVVRLLTREDPSAKDSQFSMKHYPVFEYYADSRRYTEVYPFGSYPARYKTGQQLPIDYDPASPRDFEIHVNTAGDILPTLLYTGGVILLCIGAVLFIIFASRS